MSRVPRKLLCDTREASDPLHVSKLSWAQSRQNPAPHQGLSGEAAGWERRKYTQEPGNPSLSTGQGPCEERRPGAHAQPEDLYPDGGRARVSGSPAPGV